MRPVLFNNKEKEIAMKSIEENHFSKFRVYNLYNQHFVYFFIPKNSVIKSLFSRKYILLDFEEFSF